MMKPSMLFVLFLISPALSGQPEIKVPLLKKTIWQRPLSLDKDLEEESEKAAKAVVDRALEASGAGPLVPGFLPMAAGDWLVYRTYSDVRSVFLAAEKDKQGKILNRAGDIWFKGTPLDGGTANILSHKDLRATMENWLNKTFARQPKSANFLFENSLHGRLSTSHRLVYAVDDLAIPAPQAIFPWMWGTGTSCLQAIA